MSTLPVTCPSDGHQFVVVEPTGTDKESFTVICPRCSNEFEVVYPSEKPSPAEFELWENNPHDVRENYVPLRGMIDDWTFFESDEAPDPYTGSDQNLPVEQFVVVKGQVGGDPRDQKTANKMGFEHANDLPETYNPKDYNAGELGEDTFKIWYTPDHEGGTGNIRYVLRSNLETGTKTKNVYQNANGRLYIKNRGLPWDSDKQWTFLDRDECIARAKFAGLEGDVEKDSTTEKSNRYNIFLDEEEQLLVTEDGELAEALVLELARVLIAFQTYRVMW